MDVQRLAALVEKQYSTRMIANELSVSQTTVQYWVKKTGLTLYRLERGKLSEAKLTYRCGQCGETDATKFYGRKRTVCGQCHNKYTAEIGRAKRARMLGLLGSRCLACGFDRYPCALDVHHVDAAKKDPDFAQMRSWAWSRIEKEIHGCVLLCKNCHAAFHAGLIDLPIGV